MPPTPGLPPPPPHPSTSKRPAPTPISAGAFSFSLPTSTPKRTRLDPPTHTPLRPSDLSSTTPKASISRAGPSTVTPHRPVHSLNALPSPFGFPPVTPGPRTHKRLTAVLDDNSPFRAGPSIKQEEENLNRVPLGQLTPGRIEDVPRERVKREEEGIGVSPRKTKGLKWTGKGPPPPSLQLANLLSSTTSSLLLFYNSLQRTLHPPIQVPRPGTPLNAAQATPITAKQYIRTAPIVVRLLQVVDTRTHHGILLQCEIIVEKQPEQSIRDTDENDPFSTDIKTNGAASSIGQNVLVNLQPVPHECPRLGVDPKVVLGKMQEGTEKKWEMGIWSPYHITELVERPNEPTVQSEIPSANPDAQLGLLRVDPSDEMEAKAADGSREKKKHAAAIPESTTSQTYRVILASRYLIAETT